MCQGTCSLSKQARSCKVEDPCFRISRSRHPAPAYNETPVLVMPGRRTTDKLPVSVVCDGHGRGFGSFVGCDTKSDGFRTPRKPSGIIIDEEVSGDIYC